MKVYICGSLNYDLVTFTDRIPDAGETFKANKFETHAGGKGLNQTIAVSRLLRAGQGVKVSMIGHVGDDSFAGELVGILSRNEVDTRLVTALKGVNTGVATIIVEQKTGQNRILISEGANGHTNFNDDQLEAIFPAASQSEGPYYVIFQNEIPGTIPIMRWLKQNRPESIIVYNPSPFKDVERDDWSLVDLLMVNEIEALQVLESGFGATVAADYKSKIDVDFLAGYKEVATNLQSRLISGNPSSLVVITLGEKGCVFTSKESNEAQFVEARRVEKVVDTTGAGDTFLGGVISQLCTNHSLRDSIAFATKASSISIQRSGAAESIPVYSEV
ncbi:LAQU0S27e00474g1_1 [Lachancea quebecensis]|uniref:Ribokinase n=1 Tax=Lachancea quebecensis TaxID=1654605 RepID=A0A0P1KY24_9SACH|nr:LAQU0S27e00474g1_1 [Lachancea quebecensis]